MSSFGDIKALEQVIKQLNPMNLLRREQGRAAFGASERFFIKHPVIGRDGLSLFSKIL